MAKPYDFQTPCDVGLRSHSVRSYRIERKSWLVAAVLPGIERRPLQKLPVDENRLLQQLERWREEVRKIGATVRRVVVAFEAGRDGFWLARWLPDRGVEVYVIHPTSVPVPRDGGAAGED
jgi:transposase